MSFIHLFPTLVQSAQFNGQSFLERTPSVLSPMERGVLESTEELLISALLSFSLVLRHIYICQYLRFIMKTLSARGNIFLGGVDIVICNKKKYTWLSFIAGIELLDLSEFPK